MLTSPPTQELIAHWQSVYKKYRLRLAPNKKSTTQVIDYHQQKYPLEAVDIKATRAVIIGNISG